MGIEAYVIENEDGLSTAVVHLVHPDTKMRVNLVGTAHIGRPSYYAEILDKSNGADVVLYEDPGKGKNPFFWGAARLETKEMHQIFDNVMDEMVRISPHQMEKHEKTRGGLKEEVRLVSQVEGIDYGSLPRNWKSSDVGFRENPSTMGPSYLFKALKYVVASKLGSLLPSRLGGDFLTRRAYRYMDELVSHPDHVAYEENRQDKIIENVSELETEQSVDRIDVLYGAGHLEAVERKLGNKGYVRDAENPIEYLRAKFTPTGLIKSYM